MSTGDLKSIDKLRDTAFSYAPNIRRQVNMACDDLEAEIAERYIELPVDADGVPIHVGDVIQFVNEQGGTGAKVEVCAISKHYAYYGEGKHFYKASMCRHVKPRTIEDVLRDCCNEWNEHCGDDWESGVYAKYAEEIRGMMA